MAVLVCLAVLFLALTGHSHALYCVCKSGLPTATLQKTLDYACGAGADCTPVLQNGACYQPNTVQDHCSYAVNSYYQKSNQLSTACDFAGSATTSTSPPSTVVSPCVYPATASATGTSTTTPTTSTPGTSTNTTPTSTGTTTTGGTTTTPTGVTPTTTAGTTSSSNPSVYNLGPTGSGSAYDNGVVAPLTTTNLLVASMALGFSCLVLVLWG